MSDIGRGLLKPIIYTNPGESTDPADYRKEKIVIAPELNPFATPEVAKAMEAGRSKPLRGMSSVIFHIDDFCGPSEELLFEEEGVKFFHVTHLKNDSNIWYRIPDNQVFSFEIEIADEKKRGYLTYLQGITGIDQTIKSAIRFMREKHDLPIEYRLPLNVVKRINEYLQSITR